MIFSLLVVWLVCRVIFVMLVICGGRVLSLLVVCGLVCLVLGCCIVMLM